MKTTSVKMKTLEFIKNSNGISRAELAKELNITPAGIGKIVNGFLKKGIIKEYGEGISTGGRKPLILKINEENIGVILGTKIYSNIYWRYKWQSVKNYKILIKEKISTKGK